MEQRSEQTNNPPVRRKKRWSILFFAIGLAGVAVMLLTMDLSEVDLSAVMRLLPVWVPALLGLWAVNYLVHTAVLAIILGGRRVPSGRLYAIVLAGFALNHVTPAGMVGGAPYRIMALKEYVGVDHAASSSFLFSFMQTLSHIVLLLVSAVLYFVLLGKEVSVLFSTVWALTFVCCAVILAAVLLSRRHGAVRWLFRVLSHLPFFGKRIRAFAEKHEDTFASIDCDIIAFRMQRGRFLLTLLLECLTRALEVLEFYFIFRLLDAPLSFAGSTVAYACASLFGIVTFIMPMQIGTREGGLALALSWFSEPASLGLTASLLSRIREIFYILLGLLLLLVGNKRTPENQVKETGT